jgi:WD40 repeat protein/class 3 adenylate cyclase
MEERAGADSRGPASGHAGTTGQGETPPKLLTFLIADIRGYSTFTRERGDAAAAILAQRFADLARDAVEARSGRVLELRGDEAFAVFDSAAQAVRAAIDVQATFAEESRAEPAFQQPVGIGIDGGEAVPVEGGYRGAAVNMAARLCSSAAPGQVLVTRTVVDRVGSLEDVTFADRGLATFKGFEEPVEVIEALSVAHARAARKSPGGAGELSGTAIPPELDPMTPLVNREREMRWLRGTWRQVRRSHGRILLVSGPGQIGKTRLAAELASFVNTDGADVWYAGQGGTGTALAMSAIRDVTLAQGPVLLVLDDIDVAGPGPTQALGEMCDEIAGRSVLVLGLLRDRAASIELASLIDRVDERGDGHRILGPFGLDDVRGIVRLYLGEAEQEAPVESFARASEGVPGRVHEVVSDWTRSEASRRLSAAAEFLATGRERHASDLEFANNAISVKLGRLYTLGGRDVLAIETCPYKGLAQFDAADSALFFGRERLVGELAARTVGTGLLGVVGASGSGKSSAIAAGLLPSLDAGLLPGSERWTHVTMRPGAYPMGELRRVLGSNKEQPLEASLATTPEDGRLVLVIDQFEEVFTLCGDEAERAAFVDALIGPALRSPERVVVVPSIRGDHFAHVATYPEFAESLAANTVLVGPLSRDELRRAIELPARRAGLRIESALVDALVEEVADEPGSLPLLSTALVELWQSRDTGWIRMRAYEQTGGVEGAVARLAEASYSQLSDSEQEAARRVLLRLVVTDESETVSKRRVALDEFDLDRDAAAAAVIARLTQDRLLTVGDGTVEVSHEALLREWPRLSGWVEEDIQGHELHQHLMEAAREWLSDGRDPADLYRGARLASAMDWTAEHPIELNHQEREFLEQSRAANDAESARTRRVNRRLKGSLVGVALFLVVAVVAASLATQQRSHARDVARVADAKQLAAQALSPGQPLDRSLLLASGAVHLDDSLPQRSALLSSLLRSPSALHVFQGTGPLGSMAVTPDGRLLAVAANTGDVSGEVLIFDTATGREVGDPIPTARSVLIGGLAISPDGKLIAAALDAAPGALDLIDIATRAVVRHTVFRHAWNGVDSVAFTPDGTRVAVDVETGPGPFQDSTAETVEIYETNSGRRVESLALPANDLANVTHIGFTQDGTRLITSTDGASTNVWDLASRGMVEHFDVGGPLAVSPDGRTVAVTQVSFEDVSHAGGPIRLIGLRSGRLNDFESADAVGLAFSRDGTELASANPDDQSVTVWDVASGASIGTFSGHIGPVYTPAFSPDGRTLYASGFDGEVVAWDVSGQRGLGRHVQSSFDVLPYFMIGIPYALSDDGMLLATIASGGRVDIWNAHTLHKVNVLPAVGSSALAFSPDGSTLAVGDGDGRVVLWNAGNGDRLDEWTTRRGFIGGMSFSPDGARLAIGVDNRRNQTGNSPHWTASFEVWGVTSHQLLDRFQLRGSNVLATFSPDGRYLLGTTCCRSGASPAGSEAGVWDLSSRNKLFAPSVAGGVWVPAFSPDSSELAVGDLDGSVAFYSVPSGEATGHIAGLNEGVESVAFSPDGTELITAGQAGTIQLWDVASLEKIGSPFPGVGGSGALAAFTTDGKHIVATFDDRSGQSAAIYIWTVDPAAWRADACAVAGRNLTPEEWSSYLPDRSYESLCPA